MLDDLRIMPMAFIHSNSDLAAASLSGGRRRAQVWTGGPLVVMKCCVLCLVGDWTKLGIVMSGKVASSTS